jgi:integrase
MSYDSIKKKETKKDHLIDVQPIRDLDKLEDMKWALKRFCSHRDYVLFLIGINTGLRISDLLRLTTQDVRFKKSVLIREGKTKKPRRIYLDNIYQEIQSYLESFDNKYLFPSRKGNKPISTTQAYRQLQKAAEMAEIESIGTHTMRKTFGYWFYKQHKDIGELQEILNHSHPDITKRYIGIRQEQLEEKQKGFRL